MRGINKMIITLIMAAMSRTSNYIKTWQMEPVGLAQLAALTPKDVIIRFYDDRLEAIDYDAPTDYVAISIETYSAQRGYEIMAAYQQRGKKIIAGGFHPTLMTAEVLERADSVIVGEAENVWQEVIADCRINSLKKVYKSQSCPDLTGIFPDRSIFANKKYMPIALIESSRGCRFNCQFCSIAAFYQKKCHYRPIADVVKEVRESTKKMIFFVDDNIGSDVERAKDLFRELAPLNIKWFSQITTSCLDDEMAGLMRQSGCLGVLIGFESFNKANLTQMQKAWNIGKDGYVEILNRLTQNRIFVYGTFIFGYDEDDEKIFEDAFNFAVKNNLVLAAFNHLMPFPGTPLYDAMRPRLKYDKWWLGNQCKFGDVVFEPKKISAERLAELCYVYKKKFYSLPMLLRRAWGLRWCLFSHLGMMSDFFKYNWICNSETTQRRGFKIGKD